MLKPNEVFNNVLEFSTDSEYRSYGKYHFSDLQSIYLNQPQDLNPEFKQERSERIGRLPQVIGGVAFEEYQRNQLALNDYHKRTVDRPTATMGELCDKLVEETIDPNNIEDVAEIIKTYGYWAGSAKTDAAIKKKASLPADARQYVIQEQFLKTQPIEKIITVEQERGIINSTIALNRNYPTYMDVPQCVMDVKDLMLEWNGFVIKLDRVVIMVEPTTDMKGKYWVQIQDYKFRMKSPKGWVDNAYWQKGYWIQGNVYSKVVQECLKKEINGVPAEFWGFYFIIGGTEEPEYSNVVVHPQTVTNELWSNDFEYQGGSKIKSITTLCKELDWHRTNDAWNYTYEEYQNALVQIPRVPKFKTWRDSK